MNNDIGILPTTREWTDAEKKLVAFSMAIQASMTQFIAEKLFSSDQQQHFLVHLQDFAARLYAGEDVTFGPDFPTYRVLSQAGDLFLSVTESAIKEGRMEHGERRAVSLDDDNNVVEHKPTVH